MRISDWSSDVCSSDLVSRAELWSEDRWQEPMRRLRAESPIHYCEDSKFGPYWSVTTYKPIQHIEALPKIFSSSWDYGGITVAGDGVDHLQEGDVPKIGRAACQERGVQSG